MAVMRHLISATLTTGAYEIYQRWSSKRKGSQMLSRAIEDAEILILNEEAFRRYKKVRLPHTMARILRVMTDEQFKSLDDETRSSIVLLQEAANINELREMGWSHIDRTADGSRIARLDDEVYSNR
jgi:phage/plasmid-associated DNA primase